MGFWQLLIFINVLEHQSFSEAAKACGLTQPTVSSHIKQLEEHFDCILIDRIGKKAIATKAGSILYEYAKRLMALKSKAETAISEYLGNMKGSVSIGGSTIPGVYILPKILGKFKTQYPNISFSLDIDSSGNVIRKLHEGSTELGIVGFKTDQRSISQQKIISDEMKLVIPADHRWSQREEISFDALIKEHFIKREDGSGTWNSFQKGLKEAGFHIEDLNIVAEIKHTSGIISGIKNHLGVSVLSPIAVTEEIKAGKLKTLKIKGVDLKRSFYLTWSTLRTMSPIIGLLKDYIEAEFNDKQEL